MPRSRLLLCAMIILTSTALAGGPRTLELAGPDKAALQVEDDTSIETGGPERFAWPADVVLASDDGEGWDRLPGGEHRWRLRVNAPGSLSLNFGFERFRLPWGGRLTIEGEQGPRRTFTAADNRDDGRLWTPVVLGDSALLTLVLPAGQRDDHEIELKRVGRGYRTFGEPQDKLGSCNIDVACSQGDPWRDEIRSVAVYTVDGVFKCTGAMINNTAEDGTPYFLTAFHCGVTEENAASVVTYWNFESPVCGQLGGGSLADAHTGTTWRAAYMPSDMTLLELSSPPDPDWGVTWAGWDRTGAGMAAAVTIHHPDTEIKCISFEDDPLGIDSYLNQDPVDDTHWRVFDWDLGTTEHGSSGCPLFDTGHRIVGQLHGGYAACDNDASDWYGRVSTSWTGGGEPSMQLASWLDPQGTGAGTLNLFDPLATAQPDSRAQAILIGASPNPATGATTTISFRLKSDGEAKVSIYDLVGRFWGSVDFGVVTAGEYSLPIGDDAMPSGVYICRLEALGEEHSGRFTLLR